MVKAEFKIYLLQVDKRRKKNFVLCEILKFIRKWTCFTFPQTKKNRSQSLAIDLNER